MKNNKNQKRGNQDKNQNANQYPGTRQDSQMEQRDTQANRNND